MAYVINQEDDNQAAGNVATNIFNQATGQGGQTAAQAQGAPQAGGGDQSQAIGPGGGSASPDPKALAPDSASSSKEVVRRNDGKLASPYDVKALSGNIQQSQKNLQDEANNYVTSQKQKAGALGDDVLQKALTDGGDAENQVRKRLYDARPGYEEFKPTTQLDYSKNLGDIEDSSLRNYFKSQSGPMGTAGEAALDSMLLGRNKEFRTQREEAKQAADALSEQAKSLKAKTDTDAKAEYEKDYDEETNRIKSGLQSRLDPVRQAAEQKAAEETARRQALSKRETGDIYNSTPNYKKWLYDLGNQVAGNNPNSQWLHDRIAMGLGDMRDPGQGQVASSNYNFLNMNNAPVSANNFLDQNQAGMLNRGYSLLGQGAPGYQAAGPLKDPYSFNADAAKAYLTSILGKKDASVALAAQQAKEKANKAAAQAAAAAQAKAAAQEAYEREQRDKYENSGSEMDRFQKKATAPAAQGAKAVGDAISRNTPKW